MPKAGTKNQPEIPALAAGEQAQATGKVMVPESDISTGSICGCRVDIRPMTIKFARLVASITDPIFSDFTKQAENGYDEPDCLTSCHDGKISAEENW